MTVKSETVERVKITVTPSAAHPDVMAIQDALKQVVDFFDLLTPEEEDAAGFTWNLRMAATNSPLTIEGEAVSLIAGVDVSVIARLQTSILAENCAALREGRRPVRALSKRKRSTLRRALIRNMNGIGKIEAILPTATTPVLFTPTIAQHMIATLDRDERDFSTLVLNDRISRRDGVVGGGAIRRWDGL